MAAENWKSQLRDVFQKDLNILEKRKRSEEQSRKDKLDADWIMSSSVMPLFEEIKSEFTRYNRNVRIVTEDDSVALCIYYYNTFLEYTYQVQFVGRRLVINLHCSIRDENLTILSNVTNEPVTIDNLTKEMLGAHFVEQYNRYKRYFPET